MYSSTTFVHSSNLRTGVFHKNPDLSLYYTQYNCFWTTKKPYWYENLEIIEYY